MRVVAGGAARSVFEAISPDSDVGGGARVRVGLDGDCITMEFEADRPQHLRAALNSHLRLAHAGIESVAQ